MPTILTVSRLARLAAVVGVAFALAACAKPGAQGGADLSITGGASAPGSGQDFVVNVGDRVFFLTDSAEFTPEAIATLSRQVQWLQHYAQYGFTIEGHADERGTREYNISLGARRASAVQSYFVARGVAPNRIRTISYGKERPVAVCNDISCWSVNRRAVIVLNNAGV
jgi:peptidoglycan-associated lipoprotein